MSKTLMKLPELNGLNPNEITTFKKIAEEIAECNEAVEILNSYEDTHNSSCLLLSDEEVYKIREQYKILLNNVMGEIMDIAQTSASQLFIFEKYDIDIQELFEEYMVRKFLNTGDTKQMIFQTKDSCRYVYFSPTNIDTSLRSTMNKIILSLGKIAQLGKFTGENGEAIKMEKLTSNKLYVSELFEIIQNCFNLLYSMESKYHIDLKKLFDDHINKLIRKKYYKPLNY